MTESLLLATLLLFGADATDRQVVIAVVGAPGNDEYGEQFAEWASRWQSAATSAKADFKSIGTAELQDISDRETLQRQLEQIEVESSEPVWLVLIGHGTFDGKVAKFNLRGADVTANELADWLKRFQRPVAVINCASSSGPFVTALAGDGRVVLSATKSGFEQNFARFGDYISQTIADASFDLDKDEQTSLLEAFIAAAKGVEEFYESEGRLATEHALLEDNGDGRGTPADWFRGVRAIKAAKDGAVDGQLANRVCLQRSEQENNLSEELRHERDELVAKIESLRNRKGNMSADAYYLDLETLMVALAKLYASADVSVRIGTESNP
ncbi:MAG: hypothetical protein H6822_16255 [Planctomycetaceae bacterium]|nr:hypothetical protein [Planctomycetales bacterium]MCB9923734.1 hypothetical protein [Planctomycetaceae bacterium]